MKMIFVTLHSMHYTPTASSCKYTTTINKDDEARIEVYTAIGIYFIL